MNYIIKFDLRGRLVAFHSDLKTVRELTGIRTNDVKRVIRGERRVAGGYQWREVTVDNLIKE